MGLPAKKQDRTYTYGDYRKWPGDERWELIDGVAWNMSAAPNRFHQGYITELARQISNALSGKRCRAYVAPFDVLLPDHAGQEEDDVITVVQPDISVICDRDKLTDKGCTGAPDWIIEILSPSTSRKDMQVKRDLYQHHGVREYWIVDPGNKYIQVYILNENGKYPEEPLLYIEEKYVDCSAVEGITIDLQRVFKAE